MASVDFFYQGNNIIVQCNNNDRMSLIFQRFIDKSGVNPNSVIYLYNGKTITNKELTFDQLSNSDDKFRCKMNIIVINSSEKSSSQFTFLDTFQIDESMQDFSKMAILLAFQECPDDGGKMCALIKSKFEERYGGKWLCCIYKDGYGNISFDCYAAISIKYLGYKISIIQTQE